MKNEYLEAGRFNGTHGIKGDIKAECWCDDFSVLRNLTKVYLKEKNGYRALRIRRCVPYRDLALLHIEGYENPEDASVLKNRVFFAKREDLPLEEGFFFIADLLGLRVYDADTGRRFSALRGENSGGKDGVSAGRQRIYCGDRHGTGRGDPSGERIV